MEEAYEKVNIQRKRRLEKLKGSAAKRKRIQYYKRRTKESLQRIEWSNKHGRDSYDTTGCGNVQGNETVRKLRSKKNFRVKLLKHRLKQWTI